jgi:hypothetical protein
MEALLALQDTTLAPLPSWAAPATPERNFTTVGISADGLLYIYGDSAASPGPILPSVLGVVTDVQVSRHGGASRYGLRDYLDLYLGTAIPGEVVVLRLPCQAKPHLETAELQTPWSVRSLMGALLLLDLPATAIKLQTKRGNTTTFFRVFPHSPEGVEQPEIRAEPIGPSQDDLAIAVNRLRSQLGLIPQLIEPFIDVDQFA